MFYFKQKTHLLGFFLFLTFVSCTNGQSSSSDDTAIAEKIGDVRWRLMDIQEQPFSYQELFMQRVPFLTLSIEDNKLQGNSSCNTFFADFILDGHSFTIEDITLKTKMDCQNASEHVFFDALRSIDAVKLDNDDKRLIMISNEKPILTFQK